MQCGLHYYILHQQSSRREEHARREIDKLKRPHIHKD